MPLIGNSLLICYYFCHLFHQLRVNYIIGFPEAFPVKYDEIRVAVVAVFPYTVHYYFDQANNTVLSVVFLRTVMTLKFLVKDFIYEAVRKGQLFLCYKF